MSESENKSGDFLKPPMLRSIKGIALILALVIGMLLAQRFMSKETSFKELLEKTAAELSKTCPQMIDKDMRLDNAVALPGKILQYNYTFVNLAADSVDAELLKYSLEPSMRDNVIRNPDLELFRKHEVTFIYNFKDKAGKFMMKVVVNPDKYSNH
jgi:hypothetical protein